MPPKIPLVYTFGNHMHWVDMQWLWGYHVLPGSIRDMLHLIDQTGAKGNVNFDGVGYEKLATEDPEALQDLKSAVQEGNVEPVGCSYGQPYGLFHGGESNIRQRIYGVRAVRRLLGVWPQTFWEEEFDFFPQLPQILAQTGFKYASLYFQWTWHTPEVPVEPHAAILWEGIDGTRLVTAPRNNLNLHQWPEDFQILLNDLATKGPQEVLGTPESDPNQTPPLILQWLELMPSPDWMCRSEVMLPKLQELLQDPRFEVTCQTLGEYLATQNPKTLPIRPYSLDQTWHGLTLGKNGDNLRQTSASVERQLLAAESFATTLSLFGRPYAQWDVYPTWELEEAWRHLLMAQHHDNDECEGLCGHIGKGHYKSAEKIASEQYKSSLYQMGYTWASVGSEFEVNWNAWPVQSHDETQTIPAFGWCANFQPKRFDEIEEPNATEGTDTSHSEIKLLVSRSGKVTELPLTDGLNLIDLSDDETAPALHLELFSQGYKSECWINLWLSESNRENITKQSSPPIDPGYAGAMKLRICPSNRFTKIHTASPFAIETYKPSTVKKLRKYPKGDWMTSEQWFEDISETFTSQNVVDFVNDDGSGLLVAYQGAKEWQLVEGIPHLILTAYDPWDEEKYNISFDIDLLIKPHGPISNADRYRISQEFVSLLVKDDHYRGWNPRFPDRFGPLNLTSDTDGVVATAFYRETEDFAGKHVENYAGTGIGYPTVLRLVEFNGEPADVTLQLAGPVAKAFKTNLLGQIQEELQPTPCPTPDFGHPFEWSELKFKMKPREILTLYLDIVPARKQTRDLDAKRKIWATIHRTNP